MIYVAFVFWMFALLCLSRGIVRMWVDMIGAKAVGFLLLPGTIVSELAYYLACLLSGAEFRPRKLVDGEGKDGSSDKKPGKSVGNFLAGGAAGGAPYITPVLTSLLPLLASMGLIWLICDEMSHPALLGTLVPGAATTLTVELPPVGGHTLWTLLANQVELMKETWATLADTLLIEPWNHPTALLMHYLVACLVLRMAPSRLGARQALLGMALFTMGAALAVAIISATGGPLKDFWPLLSFTWGVGMLLLTGTLIIKGCYSLSKIFIE